MSTKLAEQLAHVIDSRRRELVIEEINDWLDELHKFGPDGSSNWEMDVQTGHTLEALLFIMEQAESKLNHESKKTFTKETEDAI